MKLWVGITDYDWFNLHASKAVVEEVNFWRPSSQATFKVLQPNELFLFKLHAPRNFIVGGGFFTRFIPLRVSLAWEAFGESNGARSLDEVRLRIAKYRKQAIGPADDPVIGCILLAEPFFFDETDWIPVPSDFKGPIVAGKSYDVESGTGRMLWRDVGERLQKAVARTSAKSPVTIGPATIAAMETARFGKPGLVTPRLGQGSFRILVTDAYRRRCAMTSERTLPALEAAHIHRYSTGGEHLISNGLLLRSDLHRLFDRGYLTVDADDLTIVVSPRIREEYENGRAYYTLHGQKLAQPENPLALPDKEKLKYHAEHVFRA